MNASRFAEVILATCFSSAATVSLVVFTSGAASAQDSLFAMLKNDDGERWVEVYSTTAMQYLDVQRALQLSLKKGRQMKLQFEHSNKSGNVVAVMCVKSDNVPVFAGEEASAPEFFQIARRRGFELRILPPAE